MKAGGTASGIASAGGTVFGVAGADFNAAGTVFGGVAATVSGGVVATAGTVFGGVAATGIEKAEKVGWNWCNIPNFLPCGGTTGSQWTFMLENQIKKIHIAHGSIMDSIMFCTMDKDGQYINSPMFGGIGGYKKLKVTIEKARLKYLIGIRGTLGYSFGKHVVVKSLLLAMKVGGGAIVGFHCCFGLYLDAIDVYLQQATPVLIHADNVVLKQPKVEAVDEFHDKMDGMKVFLPQSPGPWGGCSVKPWDDGVYN